MRNRHGRAGERGKGQRIRRTARITLDLVCGWRRVRLLRDAIHILAHALDVHAKRTHDGDGHVDIRLRNDFAAHKSQFHRGLGVRCAEQDRGHVLRRYIGSELDTTASQAHAGALDAKREACRFALVVDVDAIALESIDQRTDRTLVHARIARERNAALTHEGRHARHETRSCAGVLQVHRRLTRLHLSAVAMHHERMAVVFPRKVSYTQLDKRLHHDAGIVRMEQVANAARSATQSRQHQRAVGDALGAGRRDRGGLPRHVRGLAHKHGRRQHMLQEGVGHGTGPLLGRGA